MMIRKNFFIPENIVEALKAKADRTGLSMSELLRQALLKYLGLDE